MYRRLRRTAPTRSRRLWRCRRVVAAGAGLGRGSSGRFSRSSLWAEFNSASWTDPYGCGRPCDPAGRVPAVQAVRLDGGPDPVHRQSALTSSCAAEKCTHSTNCAENPLRSPQLLFFGRRRCEHAATSSSSSGVPQISSSTVSMAVVGGCEGPFFRSIYGFFSDSSSWS